MQEKHQRNWNKINKNKLNDGKTPAGGKSISIFLLKYETFNYESTSYGIFLRYFVEVQTEKGNRLKILKHRQRKVPEIAKKGFGFPESAPEEIN